MLLSQLIMSSDKVFHSRSQGIPSEGVKDQYADGKAARVWKKYIGDSNQRTKNYRDFLTGLLRRHGCKTVLDVACGTGYDNDIHKYVLHIKNAYKKARKPIQYK